MKLKSVFFISVIIFLFANCGKEISINKSLPGSKKRISLIHYFRILPVSSMYMENEKKHRLFLEKGIWKTRAKGVNYTFAITNDIRNGYFELKDSGTGGGAYVIQLAKYLNSEKREIIAANSWCQNPMGASYLGLHLYAYGKNKLKNITKILLPKIDIYTFIKRSFTKKDLTRLMKSSLIGSVIGYKLPKVGTTITCFVLKEYLQQFIHDRDDGVKKSDKAIIKKFLNSIKHEFIYLKWSIKKGIFYL